MSSGTPIFVIRLSPSDSSSPLDEWVIHLHGPPNEESFHRIQKREGKMVLASEYGHGAWSPYQSPRFKQKVHIGFIAASKIVKAREVIDNRKKFKGDRENGQVWVLEALGRLEGKGCFGDLNEKGMDWLRYKRQR
ncbi:MAG: hypothetical protein Q9222_003962 [Ikaeria aurantiellina]